MKRHGNLWNSIISEENIREAYRRAKLGKSRLRGVINFKKNEEENLIKVRNCLINKTFHTGRYFEKTIYEPKERTIYVLPFAPDRIVQHALINVVSPIWTDLFIPDTYACIKDRGIHKGSLRTKQFVKRNSYCLKCDISKFYPSVNQQILFNIVKKKIKCKDTLWLLEDIIFSFPGETNVPIGNLTSQWFGNLYMNELDQYVKHTLKVDDYIRYCDDFLLFGNDKKKLNDNLLYITEFLHTNLNLKLSKSSLFPTSHGVDFLGYRHFNKYVLLRKRTAKRIKRRITQLPNKIHDGLISIQSAVGQLASANGWIAWADSHNFNSTFKVTELLDKTKLLL